MKRILLLLLVSSMPVLCLADEQTQEVQQALKDQGFYYGTVDGQAGPETDAAVRRYQIRQGLEVTGKLDSQTLSSLKLGGGSAESNPGHDTVEAVPPPPSGDSGPEDSQPAESATPSRKVVESDHDFLRNTPPATPPQQEEDSGGQPQEPPQQPQQPEPQGPPQAPEATEGSQQPQGPPPGAVYQGQTLGPEFSRFFRKTPYENAPPVVQRSTVQHAQMRLAREGFFRGIVDGQLSDSLSKSLANYQRYAQLKITGRLDMDTLEDMNLLPKRRMVMGPPPMPYGDDPRDVYRGIWVH